MENKNINSKKSIMNAKINTELAKEKIRLLKLIPKYAVGGIIDIRLLKAVNNLQIDDNKILGILMVSGVVLYNVCLTYSLASDALDVENYREKRKILN